MRRRPVLLHGVAALLARALTDGGRAAPQAEGQSKDAPVFQIQGYRMGCGDALALFAAASQGTGATQLLQGASSLMRKRRASICGPWNIPPSKEVVLDPTRMACVCTAEPISDGFRVDFALRGPGVEFSGGTEMRHGGVAMLCAAPGSSATETILLFIKCSGK